MLRRQNVTAQNQILNASNTDELLIKNGLLQRKKQQIEENNKNISYIHFDEVNLTHPTPPTSSNFGNFGTHFRSKFS